MSRSMLVKTLVALLLAMPLPAAACDDEALHALRQLAGRWEVYKDGELAGELQMRIGADGCAVVENWRTVEGTHATGLHWSETVEDENGVSQPVLRQVYVDGSGWFIHAEGRLAEGALLYEGKTLEDGQEVLLRTTLRGLGTDAVEHVGEYSIDGGKTWQHDSTLNYRRIGD